MTQKFEDGYLSFILGTTEPHFDDEEWVAGWNHAQNTINRAVDRWGKIDGAKKKKGKATQIAKTISGSGRI